MNAKAKPPVAKAAETIEMGSGNVFADFGRFSSERLLHHITLMNRDMEIFIRPRTSLPLAGVATGAVTVWAAA